MKNLISAFVCVNLKMFLLLEQRFCVWVTWAWWHINDIFIGKFKFSIHYFV